MIFCAAGDPGGSRAVLPVVMELARRGQVCRVLDHGFLGRELPASLAALRLSESAEFPDGAACYLFGSSSSDILPLALARTARMRSVPVVHVLDNWSGYAQRLRHDGLPLLEPDIYAVMDEDAKLGAIADGVPEQCLRVTGHPGLGELAGIIAARQSNRAEQRQRMGLPVDKSLVVFVNEPLRQVLGSDISAQNHYGFTEDRVLDLFLKQLEPFKNDIYVVVLPHPKDHADELDKLWRAVSRGVSGQVLQLPQGRTILPVADAIAGMSSILLYDAWLCGLPTLALQPGARQASIRRFSGLPGIHYIDTEEGIGLAVANWLVEAKDNVVVHPRLELEFHFQAPARIATVVEECMHEESGRDTRPGRVQAHSGKKLQALCRQAHGRLAD